MPDRGAPQPIAREQRLRRRSDLSALQARGSSITNSLLVLRMAANQLPFPRYAFAVSRRVSQKAVVRNRIRRRLRELVRHAPVRGGWDLLFIARQRAAAAGFGELSEAASGLLRRARLLAPEAPAPRNTVTPGQGQA